MSIYVDDNILRHLKSEVSSSCGIWIRPISDTIPKMVGLWLMAPRRSNGWPGPSCISFSRSPRDAAKVTTIFHGIYIFIYIYNIRICDL